MEIKIKKVSNGYIVVVPTVERFAETDKYCSVFESFRAMAIFLEKEFNPVEVVE